MYSEQQKQAIRDTIVLLACIRDQHMSHDARKFAINRAIEMIEFHDSRWDFSLLTGWRIAMLFLSYVVRADGSHGDIKQSIDVTISLLEADVRHIIDVQRKLDDHSKIPF